MSEPSISSIARIILALVIVMLLVASSSPPQDWKQVWIEDQISFWVPSDMRCLDTPNEDSLIGRYRSPALDLRYDYGSRSDPLETYSDYPAYQDEGMKIGSKRARIVSFRRDNGGTHTYVAAAHIVASGGNALTLWIEFGDPKKTRVARQIFRSVVFSKRP